MADVDLGHLSVEAHDIDLGAVSVEAHDVVLLGDGEMPAPGAQYVTKQFVDDALAVHVMDPTPHPAYDDAASFASRIDAQLATLD